jgi:hypothetical protein
MEKNIKEAISIIEDVRKSMPECTNKAFLKGALNELNEALRLYAVSFSLRCDADCPDVEYGNCCHPSNCIKEYVRNGS